MVAKGNIVFLNAQALAHSYAGSAEIDSSVDIRIKNIQAMLYSKVIQDCMHEGHIHDFIPHCNTLAILLNDRNLRLVFSTKDLN